MAYPATVQIDTPAQVDRWRPILHWILAIPHYIVLSVLYAISVVLTIVGWLAVVLTGRLPAGIAGFQAMYLRYTARLEAYVMFLTTEYPKFNFSTSAQDPGGSQTTVGFSPALKDRNRLTSLFRFIMIFATLVGLSQELDVSGWVWFFAFIIGIVAIPAYVFLIIVATIAAICAFLGFFAVLFMGRWPAGLRNFVEGAIRVTVRFGAFTAFLTDEYPPFTIR